jgi:ABC-type amino acid transport substrate-binding protein
MPFLLRTSTVRLCCFAFLAAVATFSSAADAPRVLERLNRQSTIHLGYRAGAAPFSFKERDGTVRGYSVELCTRIVAAIQKELGLVKLTIDWIPLEAGTRLDAVAKGKVDIECGTTTIALSRYAKVDFSLPIFVDGGSVLVNASSKFTHLSDLNGAKIAFIPGTTTDVALHRALDIIQAKVELIEVKDGAEGVAQLLAGKVDGYASDRIVLVTLRDMSSDPSKLSLLDNDFSFEPYALVVRRDDPDFRLAVNRALVDIYRSGDIDTIFYKWLGGLGRPGPLLNSMFYLNTLPE